MTDDAVQSVFVAASVATVADRMPSSIRADGATLSLAPGAGEPQRLRFDGTWEAGGLTGRAAIDVDRASAAACELQVALFEPAGHRHAWRWSPTRRQCLAGALATAVASQIEQRRVAAAPTTRPRWRPLGIAVPVVAVVALSAVVASTVVAPNPVTLEAATARYREASASGATSALATASSSGLQPRERPGDSGDTTGQDGQHSAQAARAPRPSTSQATPRILAMDESAAGRPQTSGQHEGRSDDAAEKHDTTAVPEPGVYRYATRGWEEVDVPGGRRRFPGETTQTVVRTECGYRVRWDPLEERWDENSLCVRDGMPQPMEFRTYRSFFGRSVQQHFECRPEPPPKGAAWATRCKSQDTTMRTVARPLDTRAMTVDGERIEVTGLQVDSRLRGANEGERSAVTWHARRGAVLVHTEVSAQLEVEGPFGPVDYREQYTLHLASQQPHR